jgi:ribosomal protein L37E
MHTPMHTPTSSPGTALGTASHVTVPAQRGSAGTSRRRRGRVPVPALPLGSLTQREHRHTEVCRGCGSPQVTKLSLSLTDGTPVDFISCHRCEHRSWQHAGSELSVQSVLDRTRRC